MAEESKFEIKGAEQVVKNLSSFAKNVVDEIVAGCQAVQQKVVNEARGVLQPGYGYVTGTMQKSILPGDIEVTDDDIVAAVVVNVEYASYVEFGTSRSQAKPFLVPALLSNLGTFRNAMVAAAKRAKAA